MSKKQTICIVEDNPDFNEIISCILSDEGYVIKSFTNPEEALAYVSENQVEAIVSDYNMPEMNGDAFIDKVKLQGITAPVIFMTSVPDDSHLKSAALVQQAYAVLNKLHFPVALIDTLDQLFKNEHQTTNQQMYKDSTLAEAYAIKRKTLQFI